MAETGLEHSADEAPSDSDHHDDHGATLKAEIAK